MEQAVVRDALQLYARLAIEGVPIRTPFYSSKKNWRHRRPAPQSTHTMNSIPVRKLFWEELELALETQTHRLVRDIANVLGQPPDPLLKALRDERVSAYLYDEPADQDIDLSEMRCKELTLKANGAFVATCGHPVVWSSHPGGRRVCFQHSVPCTKPVTAGLPHVSVYTVNTTAYYILVQDGSVFNDAAELVGRYTDSILELFHVDTE